MIGIMSRPEQLIPRFHSMRMHVVNVREVRVTVLKALVAVPMAVWPVDGHRRLVRVTMMFIVSMHVLVLDRLVRMHVFVMFCQVQPDPEPHQRGCDAERHRHWLTKSGERDSRSDEGCE